MALDVTSILSIWTLGYLANIIVWLVNWRIYQFGLTRTGHLVSLFCWPLFLFLGIMAFFGEPVHNMYKKADSTRLI